MSKLKNGTNVYLADLRFEYDHRGCVPKVRILDTKGKHEEIATIGVELLTSRKELEELASWWVFENDPHSL